MSRRRGRSSANNRGVCTVEEMQLTGRFKGVPVARSGCFVEMQVPVRVSIFCFQGSTISVQMALIVA